MNIPSRFRPHAGMVLAALLAACSSTPPPPDWQMEAHGALGRSVEAYLTGNARVEEAEFTRARNAIASTGQIALLARAELLQQHHHPRATRGQITGIVRQQKQAMRRTGQQKMAQRLITRFAIEAQRIVILLEHVEVMLRQAAQSIQCGTVFDDAVYPGVLQRIVVAHVFPQPQFSEI
ncbi:MAG: hypothetical protein HYZ46_08100 [Nitrosomonadales bacterium]|nr:hypothetical protein [Nitrosomonadales bacterium]